MTVAATPATPAEAPRPQGAAVVPPGRSLRRVALRRLPALRFVGILPFAVYTALFLIVPTIAVMVGAFRSPAGAFTWHNISVALHKPYSTGFLNAIELSLVTSIVPGVLGVILAYAVHRSPRGTVLKRVVQTLAGMFANFGGLPLAFLFIAVIGSSGLATSWLTGIGLNPYTHGFNLYSLRGVELVYLYFQIPLMVLVVTPALDGLRPAWREAADSLGARGWQYWRYVGIPVLAPAVLGSMLLLFGSALAAYATADAMTSGSIAITSIQIGSFLNGNVIAGQENVGKALGLGLVLIIVVAIVLYALLQRRVARWLQ